MKRLFFLIVIAWSAAFPQSVPQTNNLHLNLPTPKSYYGPGTLNWGPLLNNNSYIIDVALCGFQNTHIRNGDILFWNQPINCWAYLPGNNTGTQFLSESATGVPSWSSSSGTIGGPGTSVVGDAACWNNTLGTLLSDCGHPPLLNALTLPGALSIPVLSASSNNVGEYLTLTGNGSKAATASGTFTTNHCAEWDASSNLIDSGTACLALTPTGTGSKVITSTIGSEVVGNCAFWDTNVNVNEAASPCGNVYTSGGNSYGGGLNNFSGATLELPTHSPDTTAGYISFSGGTNTISVGIGGGVSNFTAFYPSTASAPNPNNCVKWLGSGYGLADTGAPCGSGGGITGPGTTTVGSVVVWNNTSGTVVADAGHKPLLTQISSPPATVWVPLMSASTNIAGGSLGTSNTSTPTEVLTFTGSTTTNDCVKLNNQGDAVDAGAPCGAGTSSLTNTHIFVGNASNVATDVALSGDATMANTGALTNTGLNGVSLGGLATGFLFNTTSTGVPSSVAFTGTGSVVRATSPTLVTPALGTPSALVLTNATALPGGQITGSQSIPPSTLPLATTSAFGAFKPDGSTITCSAGVCSSSGSMVYPGTGIAKSTGSAWATSLGQQGTDTNLMSSGTVSGAAGTAVCLDAQSGLTTSNCAAAGSASLTFSSIGDGQVSAYQTITTTGAALSASSVVSIGPPSGLPNGWMFTYTVTGSNTVSLAVFNRTGATATLGPLTWTVASGGGGSGGGGGTVTAVTGTAPIVSSGGTTPAISVASATSSSLGVVQPDNSTITISGGVISAVGGGGGVTSIGGATGVVLSGGSGGFACTPGSGGPCDVVPSVVSFQAQAETWPGLKSVTQPFGKKVYTVATLPATCTQGQEAAVSDASSPTYLGTLTGGSTTFTPVACRGSNTWISY